MGDDLYDDDIIRVEELSPAVEPGEYDAVVIAIKKVTRFQRTQAEFEFKLVTIGPAFGVRLKGYCALPATQKGRLPAGSKLASWHRTVTAFTGGSSSGFTMRAFKGLLFTVRVATVVCDHRQQKLRKLDQYSKVADIMSVVGKVSELPSACGLPDIPEKKESP